MSNNHNIGLTLLDIGLKKAGAVQIYDTNSLDDNGNLLSFEIQLAIVTHFLLLKGSRYDKPFKSIAERLIESWTSDKSQNYPFNSSICSESAVQTYLFRDVYNAPFATPKSPKFSFIDLFAGIGGFRLALQNLGGECVFSSEWDKNAQKTYFSNFGDVPFGDITLEQTKSFIPDNFDILCAGFPCQAFSIAGYQKGFDDVRGTLFFDVAEIIRRKRPKAVFLENVKNLQSHDNGNTFKTIKKTLESMGYIVYFKVMNAMKYANVPQNRERIFIICFDPKQVNNYMDFQFPKEKPLTKNIHDCINKDISDPKYFYSSKMSHFDKLVDNIVSKDTIYQWRRQYVRENKANVCPTLTANMGTGGHNVPLILTEKGIRKLTPKECINFQGFPESYKFPQSISTSAMYKQAGNSVVVPLIQTICKQLISVIFPNS